MKAVEDVEFVTPGVDEAVESVKDSPVEAEFDANHPPEGANLIRPVKTLRSFEQARLYGKLMGALDVFSEDEDGNKRETTEEEQMEAMATMAELLDGLAVNHDDWVEFDSGPGAMKRTLAIATWYLARLGESEASQ